MTRDMPEPEFETALHALTALHAKQRADNEHSAVTQIFKEILRPERKRLFAETHGLTEGPAHRVCVGQLVGKRCGSSRSRACRWPHRLPGQDHTTVWKKDGTVVSLVTQPYHFPYTTMQATVAFCEQWGLEAEVTAWGSWWLPGATVRITYRKKNRVPEAAVSGGLSGTTSRLLPPRTQKAQTMTDKKGKLGRTAKQQLSRAAC